MCQVEEDTLCVSPDCCQVSASCNIKQRVFPEMVCKPWGAGGFCRTRGLQHSAGFVLQTVALNTAETCLPCQYLVLNAERSYFTCEGGVGSVFCSEIHGFGVCFLLGGSPAQ